MSAYNKLPRDLRQFADERLLSFPPQVRDASREPQSDALLSAASDDVIIGALQAGMSVLLAFEVPAYGNISIAFGGAK